MKFFLLALLGCCFAQEEGPLVNTNHGALRGISSVYKGEKSTLPVSRSKTGINRDLLS